MQNIVYGTFPLIIHGNGVSKPHIDALAHYIPKAWNPKDGCTECLENTIDLSKIKVRRRNLSKMNMKLFDFYAA